MWTAARAPRSVDPTRGAGHCLQFCPGGGGGGAGGGLRRLRDPSSDLRGATSMHRRTPPLLSKEVAFVVAWTCIKIVLYEISGHGYGPRRRAAQRPVGPGAAAGSRRRCSLHLAATSMACRRREAQERSALAAAPPRSSPQGAARSSPSGKVLTQRRRGPRCHRGAPNRPPPLGRSTHTRAAGAHLGTVLG